MLRPLKYLKPLVALFCYLSCFEFFREGKPPEKVTVTFLSHCGTAFTQTTHKQINISKFLQLTGKNKFIG
jgi:hypothetical protein